MKALSAQSDPQHCAHLAWLHALYILLEKARRDGLLALEETVLEPGGPNGPFGRFPLTRKEPYLTFVRDVCQQRLAPVEGEALRRYGEAALWGLRHHSRGMRSLDESLLRTIWPTLEAGLVDGLSPTAACEFGRQAMPWRTRPSCSDLFDSLKATPRRLNLETGEAPGFDERIERIERFVASLQSDEPSESPGR